MNERSDDLKKTEVFKPSKAGPTVDTKKATQALADAVDATNTAAKASDSLASVGAAAGKGKAESEQPKTHKMLEGEEFWQVATRHGVSVRQLAELNKIWNLAVAPGVVIQLP